MNSWSWSLLLLLFLLLLRLEILRHGGRRGAADDHGGGHVFVGGGVGKGDGYGDAEFAFGAAFEDADALEFERAVKVQACPAGDLHAIATNCALHVSTARAELSRTQGVLSQPVIIQTVFT